MTEVAHADAVELFDATKEECRRMVAEARGLRNRALADLVARRRALRVQLEELRTGKDSLLRVVDDVAASVDELRQRLASAEDEARVAAEQAGERVAQELGPRRPRRARGGARRGRRWGRRGQRVQLRPMCLAASPRHSGASPRVRRRQTSHLRERRLSKTRTARVRAAGVSTSSSPRSAEPRPPRKQPRWRPARPPDTDEPSRAEETTSEAPVMPAADPEPEPAVPVLPETGDGDQRVARWLLTRRMRQSRL